MSIIITGSSGFIGYSLAKRFLQSGFTVIGVDIMNSYYDISLKKSRLNQLKKYKKFFFHKIDLCNQEKLNLIFTQYKIKYVFNLAAQAGVRYSVENPDAYFNSNILGFYSLLSSIKKFKVKYLFYASTSSVYGKQSIFPIQEKFDTNNPLSFYAATKKTNEILADIFSKTYSINCVGLRFFTVYGPYGRPDMSLFKFVEAALNNKKIDVYNYGKHSRDFTYVDDVTESIFKLFFKIKEKNEIFNEIFNVGNSKPIELMQFIKEIELNLNKKIKINFLPMQFGDVEKTHSSSEKLQKFINYRPNTSVKIGIRNFIEWYKDYYNV